MAISHSSTKRGLALALALSLAAASCSSSDEATDANSGAETVTESGSTEQADSGSTEQAESESAGDAESVNDESHSFPSLATTNIATGSTIDLAEQLAGGETPVLLWFFAPH